MGHSGGVGLRYVQIGRKQRVWLKAQYFGGCDDGKMKVYLIASLQVYACVCVYLSIRL